MLRTLDLQTLILFSQKNASIHFPNSNRIRIQIQTQIKTPIVCARRGRRRSRALSQNTIRFLTNLASLVAPNLQLLPPPLNLVLEEIAGGDGGGGGGPWFWKGFGWEGFDGWRRGRKRKKSNLWMYGFAAIWVLGFLFWGEFESNAIWWGLGFGPFGVAVIRRWSKIEGVQGWVFLGFCIWSFVVGMSFRREELRKWVSGVRVSIPWIEKFEKTNKKNYWKSFLRR